MSINFMRKGTQLRVLIVDPRPESRTLVKGAVRGLSYVQSVFETANVNNVVHLITRDPVDLVLIEKDLGHDEDVFELVSEIRAHPSTGKVSFVLIASSLSIEHRRRGMEVGIYGYLRRPFHMKGLEMAIRDACGTFSSNHRETLDKIRRIPFFHGLSDMELVRLLKLCHTRRYQKNDFIFHEGEIGDRLYILIKGEVQICKRRSGGIEVLTAHRPGDVFGEMSILDSAPRSADALVTQDAMLIEVSAFIINDPNDVLALKLFRKLAILLTHKLRAYTQQTESGGSRFR